MALALEGLRAQGYNIVEYTAFRDLKECRDSAHPIALVKPFQTLGSEYTCKMQFGQLMYCT